MANHSYAVGVLLILALAGGMPAATQTAINSPAQDSIVLTRSVVVVSEDKPLHAKAAEMLVDEVRKRTDISFRRQTSLPDDATPAIVLGTTDSVPGGTRTPPSGPAVPEAPEGYAIWTDTSSRTGPTVYLVGRDDRGALFAAGRLLRLLRMRPGEVLLDREVRVATAPRYPVRGHELGYRHTSNTYDAWDLAQYEQCIRDLAVFGANAVQLLFEGEPGPPDGPHMKESAWDMTPKLTKLVASYGLQVWLWVPLSDEALSPEEMERALELRRQLFERCPSIDVVFVPGGDPGGTHPRILLPWLAELADVLAESHPNAQLWLSNEDMEHEWNDYLFDYLQKNEPDWLDGVVFGTWTKLSLEEERARTPKRYPIVRYADITHCIECQYPVPAWDGAFAFTLGREPINPRPRDHAHIHNLLAPLSIGFITYSDGVNDDVNKFIWAALGWDPEADVESILTEYGRYFVGEDHGKEVAEGLFALERNWRGPLLTNEGVEDTLMHWQALEKKADTSNWRLQAGLFRAYYDAYIRRKLLVETRTEENAYGELERASVVGVPSAIQAAKRALATVDETPTAPELRRRIEELGEALFKSIGMQLSVDKYGAKNWERGAVLDALDRPLNNRLWLEMEFEEALAKPEVQGELLRRILTWEDPGPGGYYDDLGNATKEPRLVRQKEWADDPGFVESPQDEFIEVKGRESWRLSWLDQAQTLFGAPLRMRYDGLDPEAGYRLRVVYAGRFRPTQELIANGKYEVHGPLPQPGQPTPQEFEIPREATRSGVLELEWHNITGRGCQVAEVWLLRRN